MACTGQSSFPGGQTDPENQADRRCNQGQPENIDDAAADGAVQGIQKIRGQLLLDIRPEECMLVEDNIRNLQPAKALGMTTVLVTNGHDAAADVADYVIARIEDIDGVLAKMEPPSPLPDGHTCQTS